jgi:hypothetical protein
MDIRDNLCYVDSRYSDRPWPLRNDHILALFDLPPNGPIPPNHSDKRQIGNITVQIVPRGALKIKRRVVAQCPTCFKWVCAGHLWQHMKVHNDRRASKI